MARQRWLEWQVLVKKEQRGDDMLGLGLGLNKGSNTVKSFASLVKSAGGVLYLDARKADGSAPLTGNDSPWVDLTGNGNNATMFNQAGTVASGWQGPPYVNRLDGADDYGGFADTASLDITTAPLAIGVTIKPNVFFRYVFAKNLDSSANNQYGLFVSSSTQMWFYLEGNQITINGIDLTKYANIVCCWDGADIFVYQDGVQVFTQAFAQATLTSRPNVQIGARSNSIDGTSKSLFYNGDIATVTIYTGSDINKILAAEAKISAQYLALNP